MLCSHKVHILLQQLAADTKRFSNSLALLTHAEVTMIFCRMIATVFDLQASICSAENVSDFASLQVGPLVKMPLVQNLFQLPADQQDILQVGVAHKHC